MFINAEGEPRKILHQLSWTDRSNIASMEDGKTMTNVINISCSNGSATLECGKGYSGETAKKRILANVKNKMYNKMLDKVIVQALGT